MHKIIGRMRRRGGHGDQIEPTGDHRRHLLLIIAAIGVVIIVVVLHLTGAIGPGSH
jgi:hypothetical protein